MSQTDYDSIHTGPRIDEAISRSLPGGAIDLALSSKPNPNLLDNWYFGNPVNQRGQNEYTNSDSYSYGIDRWICRGIALSDTGITFTESGSFMDQILELAKKVALSGKAVTASVLLDSGELIYGTLQYESSVSEQKFFATGNIQLVLLANGIIRLYSIGNYTAVATKLELGTQQTLAHQENGVWVLNEIPNYSEQLRRCQRYCCVMNYAGSHYAAGFGHTVSTTQAQVFFPVPAKMRVTPTISFTDGGAWSIKCNGATIIPTSISAWFASDYVIGVKVSGTFPGAFYPIDMTSNSGDNVIFSADL